MFKVLKELMKYYMILYRFRSDTPFSIRWDALAKGMRPQFLPKVLG